MKDGCFKLSLPEGRSVLLLKKDGLCTINFIRPYVEEETPVFGKTERVGDEVVTALNLSPQALNGLVRLCREFNMFGFSKESGQQCMQDVIETIRSPVEKMQQICNRF